MSQTRTSRGRPSTWLGETRLVSSTDLHPNPWNVNKLNAFQFGKLLESIRKYGFFDPILVRACVLHGDFEIIGGEHRWEACNQLGILTVPVIVMDVDDTAARKISLIDNELHGQADPNSLSSLLRDLMDRDPSDILTGLPYTPDILTSLTGFKPLPDLPAAPPPNQPGGTPLPPAGGAAPDKWVERTYRMPQSVAEVLDQALARAREQLSDDAQPFEALEILAAEFLASA
jgi:hypothetical protein